MKESLFIFDPVAPRQDQPPRALQTLDTLAGKVVGFIDNAKPNFDYLVEELEPLLVNKHGVAGIIKRRKRGPSIAAPDTMMEELCAECDAIIVGSGD